MGSAIFNQLVQLFNRVNTDLTRKLAKFVEIYFILLTENLNLLIIHFLLSYFTEHLCVLNHKLLLDASGDFPS